jgi:hypothetical protein
VHLKDISDFIRRVKICPQDIDVQAQDPSEAGEEPGRSWQMNN